MKRAHILTLLQTMPGFVKVLTAQDIPPDGVNNVASPNMSFQPELVRPLTKPIMISMVAV